MNKNLDLIERDLNPKRDYKNYLLTILIIVVLASTGVNYYNEFKSDKQIGINNEGWIYNTECLKYYDGDGYRTYTGRSNYTCADDGYQLGKCEKIDFGLINNKDTYECECMEDSSKKQDIICMKEEIVREYQTDKIREL